MSTAVATRKWTSTAGPIQTKRVDKAIRDLRWKSQSTTKITDHGSFTSTALFGGTLCEGALEAMNAIGEKFDYTITRENCKVVEAAFQQATKDLAIPVIDERTTAEERAERYRKAAEWDAKRAEDARVKAIEKEKIVAELRAKYPWAKADDGKISRQARAAANIRKELNIAFPGISFSVRSDSFSMGDSVDVSWDCGPTDKAVQEIIGKYQNGHFDGMVDMYESDHSVYGDAVNDVLGRSKYVHSHRSFGRNDEELVAKALCEKQHVEYKDFNGTRNLYGDGDSQYLSTHVWKLLGETNFPAGAVITGVEHNEEEAGYHVTFDCPDPVPVHPDDAPASSSSGHIEKHHHTKHGWDFYLVVLDSRVEESQFKSIRSKCNGMGGWYSRKWGRCPGGFGFREEDDAKKFLASV